MTGALAILLLVVTLGAGSAFVWWCFCGAAAWLDPLPKPEPLPRLYDDEVEDSDDG